MNSGLAFSIWIPIAITQITLFSIFLFKSKNNKQTIEESLDIIPIYVYNGMAYWKEKENLVRAKYENCSVDTNRKKRVDHLNSDLLPSEIMEIIEGLENA